MAGSDSYNQSDSQISQGKTTKAIVIDIGMGQPANKQNGRVQCRLFEEINTAVPDADCPWIPIRQPTSSSGVRGVGTFPGHRLMVGSVVHCEYDNMGGHYEIIGSVHNAEMDDKNTQDMNQVATESSPLMAINQQIQEDARNYLQKLVFGKNPYEFKGTQDALNFLNGQTPTNYRPYSEDAVQSVVKHIPKPAKLGGGKGFRSVNDPNTPWTAGARSPNQGSVRSAIDWFKQNYGQKAEQVSQEFAMLDSIKQKAKSGALTDNVSMVGGAQNLSQAITSAMQIAQRANAGKTKTEEEKKEELSELERFLRALYKLETGQDATFADGTETPQYQTWKAEKIQLVTRQLQGLV